MYPGQYAIDHPEHPAIILVATGETITYGEYEARANRLAHWFRSLGLVKGDHIAIFAENHARYLEVEAAAERSGLYFTCINSYLTAPEVAYIVDDCQAKVFFSSMAKREIAVAAATETPQVLAHVMLDGAVSPFEALDAVTASMASTPIDDEQLGAAMLYSSGTTGRPKGILRPLPDARPSDPLPLTAFLINVWKQRPGQIYLSPAPLYHSAPQANVSATLRLGGTVIVMEKFDPEQYLALVEKYGVTHTQLVPTMFSRLLKLPTDVRSRYDVASLETVIHAAAPCPAPVKEAMIAWWGPKIYEYYGATEANGMTWCDSQEWLAHRGTVGQAVLGEIVILDDDNAECPVGTPGTVWFRGATNFEYFNAAEKTAESRLDANTSTVGDVGYVDEDGFLYLTDRKTYMIISGGVNIYPQECENLLITHPKVVDAAVFGVPNEDLGEEVKAVVQVADDETPGPALERELIAFCREHLAHMKCPRSIDFEAELPRLPTGKLYKRVLRDRYWGDKATRIV